MEDIIKGKAYVLGDNIDTDQIIPAQYLVYSLSDPEEKKLYGRYALSSVPEGAKGLPDGNIPFVAENGFESDYSIIIGGNNFGCGSSREHAPFALRQAGVKAVIAQSYARIFFRNSVDGGFYPPVETDERLCEAVKTGDELEIDINAGTVKNLTNSQTYSVKPLGNIQAILKAGNIFEYAKQEGLTPAE